MTSLAASPVSPTDRCAVLTGLGAHVPARCVSNDELAERLDTSDEWIRTRTGIHQRYVAQAGETTGELARHAASAALRSAHDESVDLLILATTTPNRPCPATAPKLAKALGLVNVPAFDLSAVCSGFIYGLASASAFIQAGFADRVLLVAAETYSTIVDPDDRSSAVVFGDGAGAVVLHAGTQEHPGAFLAFDLGSDGDLEDLITTRAGGSQHPNPSTADRADRYFTMQGRAVYKHAVHRMTSSSQTVLRQVGWHEQDVDRFVGHQANSRILEAVTAELGIPSDRAVINLDRVGNTAAASIPLALADAAHAGTIHAGNRVLLSTFGGGASWGSTLLRWPEMSQQ